jgi:hypothetical protein
MNNALRYLAFVFNYQLRIALRYLAFVFNYQFSIIHFQL